MEDGLLSSLDDGVRQVKIVELPILSGAELNLQLAADCFSVECCMNDDISCGCYVVARC